MSDIGRDIVLEYRGCEVDQDLIKIILINIPGQRYSFGTSYPGLRENEEFFFCRGYQGGIVSPAHFSIRVNDLGQYWIQSDDLYKPSFYKTFLNGERVEAGEKRLLKIGDTITLGMPETEWPGNGPPPYPIYSVKERVTGGISWSQTHEREDGKEDDDDVVPVSPLEIDLIVSKIMTYLPLSELKSARQVSKKWEAEGSRVLQKVGEVRLYFGVDYVNSEFGSRVFRYLKEMGLRKMQNLSIVVATSDERASMKANPSLFQAPISFSEGEPGEKMDDDLSKLLSSENILSVKTLTITCRMERQEDFLLFHRILQAFGEKLEELELRGTINYLPADLDLPFLSNLRKFGLYLKVKSELNERLGALLVPLLLPALGLEHFSCKYEGKDLLIQTLFHQRALPNLKGLVFEGNYEASILHKPSLNLLLRLQRPLETLKFHYHKYLSEPGESYFMLEQLLSRNSFSLRRLCLKFNHGKNGRMEVRFPTFPNLEELEIGCRYGPVLNIGWTFRGDRVDYEEHLPSLRTLTVKLPAYWDRVADGDVFLGPLLNSFFPPDANGLRCETVRDLCVPSLTESSHPRLTARIRKMFPNAVTVKFGRADGKFY